MLDFLNEKHDIYNNPSFIELDPISVPHRYSSKEDREIAGFFAAVIAWGQRKTVLQNANRLMEWMDEDPHQFILHHGAADLKPFSRFVHRTFNGEDCLYFMRSLKNIYTHHGGLSGVFQQAVKKKDEHVGAGLIHFRRVFFELPHASRTEKHISSPESNSACKRMNMYLRWMVRSDKRGVDFGIWKGIRPSQLICPLDVHSGRVARRIGILQRSQDDWKAALELTSKLKEYDARDPVRFDFSLFGLGVQEKF